MKSQDKKSPQPQLAIFGKPRTGTGTLFEFFKEELGLEMLHEPFHPGKWPDPYDIRVELEQIYSKHNGIKHLHAHVDQEKNLALINYLFEHGIRIIHLRRKAEFWSALSEITALKTGFWGCGPERRAEYLKKVAETPVDIGLLRWLVDHYTNMNALYDSTLAEKAFTVQYDDLYNVTPEKQLIVLKKLIEFTGVIPPNGWEQLAKIRFRHEAKQNSLEVYRLIPNRAEVETAFGVSLVN
jgi:hypothetical protein